MPMTEILMATAYNRVEFIRMKAKKVIGGDIYNNGTSPNRAYLATVLRTSAQIHLQGTSDTPGTLSEIAGGELGKD